VHPAKEGIPRRRDYEYERNGTRHAFVTVEPTGGHREVTVTKQGKNLTLPKKYNMAEIEIGIFSKQSIRGRIPTEDILRNHARIWQEERNLKRAMRRWKFTVQDARRKFTYDEGSKLS
jgi:hypothetical protein